MDAGCLWMLWYESVWVWDTRLMYAGPGRYYDGGIKKTSIT